MAGRNSKQGKKTVALVIVLIAALVVAFILFNRFALS